jgi:hypothetical protein
VAPAPAGVLIAATLSACRDVVDVDCFRSKLTPAREALELHPSHAAADDRNRDGYVQASAIPTPVPGAGCSVSRQEWAD